jgi:hypothetical protein
MQNTSVLLTETLVFIPSISTYFTAIVSISIKAPRGKSFTANAALAGGFC